MRLTIIETGRPPEPIEALFPRYPAMVEAILAPHAPDLDYETISLIDGDTLPNPSELDAVLIAGSPVGVYDPVEWIAPLKSWIVANAKAQIPQVGICFGHQIIAAAFGGLVHKAEQGWGLWRHSYDVHEAPVWAKHMPDQLHLAVSHKDQVLSLPPHAHVLASSDFTPFAALTYDHAPVLTFQGHPEFRPDFADALIRSRRGTRFPIDLADAALDSLSAPLDGDFVARWITRFYDHFARNSHGEERAAA